MPYRITANGGLETDSAQEALALLALMKKEGPEAVKPKRTYNRRQAAPAQPGEPDTTVRSRRPALAVKFGVKIGQVWRKRWDKDKDYRTIQVMQLKSDGIMPKILKAGGGVKKTATKYMSYTHLSENYVLVKDI